MKLAYLPVSVHPVDRGLPLDDFLTFTQRPSVCSAAGLSLCTPLSLCLKQRCPTIVVIAPPHQQDLCLLDQTGAEGPGQWTGRSNNSSVLRFASAQRSSKQSETTWKMLDFNNFLTVLTKTLEYVRMQLLSTKVWYQCWIIIPHKFYKPTDWVSFDWGGLQRKVGTEVKPPDQQGLGVSSSDPWLCTDPRKGVVLSQVSLSLLCSGGGNIWRIRSRQWQPHLCISIAEMQRIISLRLHKQTEFTLNHTSSQLHATTSPEAAEHELHQIRSENIPSAGETTELKKSLHSFLCCPQWPRRRCWTCWDKNQRSILSAFHQRQRQMPQRSVGKKVIYTAQVGQKCRNLLFM